MATIYGPDGEPIKREVLLKEVATPSMTGVRQVLGGHPAQGLTPQRLASLLRQAEEGDAVRYLELAEEMEEKDLHYLAVIGTRKRQVSQLEISVEPASDSPEDEANADLVRAFVEREGIEDELVDILDAIGKGYSVTEIIWDFSERQWMPRRLEYRYPQWFGFDRDDGHSLRLRRDDGTLEPLAPFKFIDHRHKAKSGLTIRGGLARPVAWWYLFKNYTVKDWITFIEIYGQPLRVGKYHAGATTEDKNALLRALSNIGTDAAAMIPEFMMIEFIENGGAKASAEIYESFCVYTDLQVSKAVLGQTTTTDAVSGGHAVSKEHNEVREDIERSDCRQLSATLNRDLARPIVDLNRGPQKSYPKIVIGRPENVDIAAYSEALAKLVPIGLKVKQSEVRQKIGAADPEDGDDLLGAPAVPAPGAPPPGLATAAAAQARVNDVADRLAEQLETETAAATDGMIDQIRELIDGAKSMEEIGTRLLDLYPDLDPSALAASMRDGMLVAELTGRNDIDG